ncbi:neuropeptide Y receptor type 6-like [Dromiciops gliroides]|uniref:neuropeptide Y receptor type 6-like n=1 Tax=Dromiciops gliroides TaxID=33562 RepID=UPI001CC4807E|nr:neuropeptide Y receptor type 6-like [Dromiciops gliroides]
MDHSEHALNHTVPNQTTVKTNSSMSLYFESCQLTSPALFILLTAYIIVIFVGLFGNLSLIIIIIKKQREAKNVTNILIANLSLSDILMCIMCIPFTVVYTLMDYWIFGNVMCKLTSYAQSVSITVSIFSLVLIAVERYQLIVNPRGWKPNMSHAYWAILVIWLFSLLLSVPFFLSYHLTDEPFLNLSLPNDLHIHQMACVEGWSSKVNQLLFTTSLLMLQYCIPLGFIFICYLRILICLRRRRNGKVERMREHESKRINIVLISIVVTFGACWLPLNIFNAIFDWYHEALMSCHHNLVFVVCHLVAMTSTCVNPLFYGFLNKNFQKDLLVFIHHCRCFAPREKYKNIAISTMYTDESKEFLKLAPIPAAV